MVLEQRRARLAAGAVAAVVAASLTTLGGAAPVHAAVPDLWAGTTTGLVCSDNGPGTSWLPFCTLQQAADVALPGQTVHVGTVGIDVSAGVVITRSGTPTSPIVFEGTPSSVFASQTGAALTVSNAHDIVLRGLGWLGLGAQDGVHVVGSSRVTVEDGTVDSEGGASAAVRIDGGSSDVLLTRMRVRARATGVVAAGSSRIGMTATTVAGLVGSIPPTAGGILASDVTGLTVVSDTVKVACGDGVGVTGPGTSTVENTVVVHGNQSCARTTNATFVVDAAAAPGAHLDYDAVAPVTNRAPYVFAGTSYPGQAAFAAGTGQGVHDLLVPEVGLGNGVAPSEGSALIDSGDAAAPGLPATDLSGHLRVDDPLVASDTAGHVDRGSDERQDTIGLGVTVTGTVGAAPLTTTASLAPLTSAWNLPVTAVADWGDGSSDPVTPGAALTHRYTTARHADLVVTARDTAGSTTTSVTGVTVATPVPAADAVVPRTLATLDPIFVTTAPVAPWQVRSQTLTVRRGSTVVQAFHAAGSGAVWLWQPPAGSPPGVWQATVTDTDVLGRTTTSPTRPLVWGSVLDTGAFEQVLGAPSVQFVAAHARLTVSAGLLGQAGPLSTSVLRVQVQHPQAAGFLQVFAGTATPATSTLDFAAGQTVTNVVVPGVAPTVTFVNNSNGRIQLVVDSVGNLVPGTRSPGWVSDQRRILDTRTGLGTARRPIPANGRISFPSVTGAIPPDVAAVVLDITTTHATRAGSLLAHPDLSFLDLSVRSTAWDAGQTRTALAVVPVFSGHPVLLQNFSAGRVDAVVDVVGWVAARPAASFLPLPQSRIADTGHGLGVPRAKIPAGGSITLMIGGRGQIPTSMTRGAVVNLTTENATAAGVLTAYADGTAAPGTGNLVYPAGQATANLAMVPTGSNGRIRLLNRGTRPVDVLVDLQGVLYSY